MSLWEGEAGVVETKTCSKCKQALPLSDFSPSGGGIYLRAECKKCNGKLAKQRIQIRKTVGLPPAEYQCPICERDSDAVAGLGGKNVGRWCVDHSHTTNQFRGWLCHDCNRALGNFKDNPTLLQKALTYLMRDV